MAVTRSTTRQQQRRGGSVKEAAAAPQPAPPPRRAPKPKPARSPPTKTRPAPRAAAPPRAAGGDVVTVNRAPVLTLWAAVVAAREGYAWSEALTIGKWVAGTLAQSKGRALGIYEKRDRTDAEREARRRREEALGVRRVPAFGTRVPVLNAAGDGGGGVRALAGDAPADPAAVQRYLDAAFGARLPDARAALEGLAAAVPAADVGKRAYRLYEEFRPPWKGWGAKGALRLSQVARLAERERARARGGEEDEPPRRSKRAKV